MGETSTYGVVGLLLILVLFFGYFMFLDDSAISFTGSATIGAGEDGIDTPKEKILYVLGALILVLLVVYLVILHRKSS